MEKDTPQIKRREKPPDEVTITDRFKIIYKHEFNKRTEAIEEDELLFRARRKLALELRESNRWLHSLLKERFRDELKTKKRREVPVWRQAPTIARSTDKTRFEDVYGYIQENTLGIEDTVKKSDRLGIPDYEQGKSRHVLFIPDYVDMEQQIGLKEKMLLKYLQQFSKMEIIKAWGKDGPRGHMIYLVGYWRTYRDKFTRELRNNRIFFLKNDKAFRQKLIGFHFQKSQR